MWVYVLSRQDSSGTTVLHVFEGWASASKKQLEYQREKLPLVRFIIDEVIVE